MAELREHHSRNMSREDMTDNELISGNGSIIIKKVGIQENKETDVQGEMVPQ